MRHLFNSRWVLFLLLGLFAADFTTAAETINFHTRRRVARASTNEWQMVEQQTAWDARHTAVVVCDMWDKHWCPDATDRVGEMAQRMNEVSKAARGKGMFIIHCPSDTMKFYENHP